MSDKCPFCLQNKLLQGEILYEDDLIYFVAPELPDIEYNGGMIITKRHIETPFEINSVEWQRIHKKLPHFKKIVDRFLPDGYNLGWNIKSTAGQNVNHAHLHFFARFKSEPMAGKGIRYAFRDFKKSD